jgi:hypothetical protein
LAASLLRDRNSFKGPGNPHARNEQAAFRHIGLYNIGRRFARGVEKDFLMKRSSLE